MSTPPGSTPDDPNYPGDCSMFSAPITPEPQQHRAPVLPPDISRDHRYTSWPISTVQSAHLWSGSSYRDAEHHQNLSRQSIGTQTSPSVTNEVIETRRKKLTEAAKMILECLGEDLNREGLRRTPERYAAAMLYFTGGYEMQLADIVNGAIFDENCHDIVIVKDIEVMSTCEHHLVPFVGKMHIGYRPRNCVLGLSKFARIAEMFSRRLQIQERLTKQVAEAILKVLNPRGVAVVMESSHLCMVMRGVQQTQSKTVTSCVRGAGGPEIAKELLASVNR